MSNEQQFFLTEPLNESQNEKQNEQSPLPVHPVHLVLPNHISKLEAAEANLHSFNKVQLRQEQLRHEQLIAGQAREQPSCVEELRLALRTKDAVWCTRMAVQAGSQHDWQAVPLLRELMRPQKGRGTGGVRTSRKSQWLDARCAAIAALGTIGDRSVIEDLCDAILSRSLQVRQAASEALLAFGADAGSALSRKLERPGNWSLNSMKTLIATLGRLEQPESAVALSRVILGELPRPPLRWKYLPAGVALAALIGYSILFAQYGGNIILLASIFIALLLTPLLTLLYLVLIRPLLTLWRNREMLALAAVAGDALDTVPNKSILPVVIAAAFGPHPLARQQIARKALLSLLPLINEEDTNFFPVTARTYLILAVGSSGEKLDLALLRAMEFVGNGQALPAVLRLARYGATEDIQREAARILPILHYRMEQAKVSSMLLRASDQPLAQADQLLRASFESAETPALELLRPAEVEQEEV